MVEVQTITRKAGQIPERTPACPLCGYSLNGLPARSMCPECGFAYDKRALCLRSRGLLVQWGWTAFGLFLTQLLLAIVGSLVFDRALPWRTLQFAALWVGPLATFVLALWLSRQHKRQCLLIDTDGLTIIGWGRHMEHIAWDAIERISSSYIQYATVLQLRGRSLRVSGDLCPRRMSLRKFARLLNRMRGRFSPKSGKVRSECQ